MQRPGKRAAIWTGAVLATLWVIGTAGNYAESLNRETAERAGAPASSAPAPSSVPSIAPAPRTVEIERVEYRMPEPCVDYLALMDGTLQAVYDYEAGIAPLDQALMEAVKALVDGDPAELNRARTSINQIENDTIGPLQDITQAHSKLESLQAECSRAMEE